MFESIKAVIFDLDGLLIDSEATYRLAWHRALAHMGYGLDHDFLELLAGADASAVEKLLQQSLDAAFDLSDFRRLSAECWYAQLNEAGMPIMPGVESVLTECKRLRWPTAVATNSHQNQAYKLLALAGLDGEFKQIFASDQVANPKPAPDIYLLAAESLSLHPAECLALEDSLTGVQAALAARMPCCWVSASHDHVANNAFDNCLNLRDLHELAARIEVLSV